METFDLAAFTRGFGLAALWADLDDDDSYLLWAEVPAAAKERLAAGLGRWTEDHIEDLRVYMEKTGHDAETVGYDVYLTAEGHGTGLQFQQVNHVDFDSPWDQGAGAVGDRLARAAQQLKHLVNPHRD